MAKLLALSFAFSCLAAATLGPASPSRPGVVWDAPGTFFASAFTTPRTILAHSIRENNAIIPPLCRPPTLPRPPSSRGRHIVSHLMRRAMVAPKAKESGSASAAVLPRAAIETAAPEESKVERQWRGKDNSRLRQLKDRMWVREALEDITAAEFASSLSVEDDIAGRAVAEDRGEKNSKKGEKKIWEMGKQTKRAVDFDNVLGKLDRRIEEMCVLTSPDIAKEMNKTCHILYRMVDSEEGETAMINTCYTLADNIGVGSLVYTEDQREALLRRLISTRERLFDFIDGNGNVGGDADIVEGEDDINDIRLRLQPKDKRSYLEPTSEDAKTNEAATKTFDPSLYVREDGTVDWDGALQDREALKKFGSAVWSRINGQDPELNVEGEVGEGSVPSPEDDNEFHTPTKVVTAKIEETKAIMEKRDNLDRLSEELRMMEKEHTKLLNSALSAGQAVANVNLAMVDAALRRRIHESSDLLEMKESEVTFQMLNYELERIFTYLDGELGNTAARGYVPLQDRLNVAEFGLLESQVESFHRQIEMGEGIDGDVLSIVADQLVDFKRRLGIDYYIAGFTFDSEAIQVWLKDIWFKTKNGFAFYVKGTRLFVDDVVFCSSLIIKALQGYTLKPREVRTLRRTFKDTITFIPVVIILLIPLSPIGHVLVFGAIQRVFPDFFPSCFTERRQNLLELYESTEYSAVTINETWTQKLTRMSQALRILTARLSSKLYVSLGGAPAETAIEEESSV